MKDRFLSALLAACLLVGLLTLTDYGESWDEHSLRKYADYSLRTYETWRESGIMPITKEDLGAYGPAYMMTVQIGARALGFLPLLPADLRHLFYFLTHLAGVWAFYQLGLRWLNRTAACYATLLYATQPLFWGHAFINPKDAPFAALFMLSLHFSLRMIDSWEAHPRPAPLLSSRARLIATGGLILLAASFLLTPQIYACIQALVAAAKAGQTNVVFYLASDLAKVEPQVYVQKYFVYFLRLRALFFVSFALAAAYLPPRPPLRLIRLTLFPALLLGFATSTRVAAPFAGLLVALYAFRRLGRRAVSPLALYALFSIVFCYLSWPYLWSDPAGHFIESLQTMTQYPWYGSVLYNGRYYDAAALPYSYLPALLALQFTEPVWVLFFVGLAAAFARRREQAELLALALLWFAPPLLGFIAARAKLYDNFRQILFILPPVFLLAGLGMEILLARLTRPALRFAAAGLLLLPGLLAGIRLHPYQYVYYNVLAGNPNERFELDYWAISYREAMEYVNAVAPPNANVMVVGPGQAAELYAREDLTVLSDDEPTREPFAYVVVTTRYGYDKKLYPEAQVVHLVRRGELILCAVKKTPPVLPAP